MNRETWASADVRSVLKDKFIPVYVDQDSRPDISQRYERWGWPATIIFAPDGTEIVKLRGFYSPQFFIPILTATIDDPSPVVYPDPGGDERGRSLATGLTEAQRDEILAFIDKAWDDEHGGWSKSKFVDGPMLIWALQRARQGDAVNTARIKKVLTLMATTMIDKTGAMNQVNLKPDWSEPAREFPMFAQEAGLAAYARAWTMFGDPAYRQAADRIFGFLRDRMAAPGGGFYASYGMSEGEPGVDRRLYTRETAQAMAGLLAYYDATGVAEARDLAASSARWALDNRTLPGGGFRHAEQDKGGPYLADNIEMAKALLALHRSTGEREWLTRAQAAADFIAKTFIDPATGGFIASASPDAKQLTKPIKQREDNVTAVRFFALLSRLYRRRQVPRDRGGRDGLPHFAAGPGSLQLPAGRAAGRGRAAQRAGACDHCRRQGRPALGGALSRGAGLSACQQARGMVGQARRKARQSRRGLSGFSRWSGGIRLHQHLLFLSGHRAPRHRRPAR